MPRTFASVLIFTIGFGFAASFVSAAPPAVAEPESDTAAKAETTTEITFFGESKLTVPADFEAAEKGSRMLDYEFAAKSGDGEDAKKARVTMMASGGGVQPNIKRWQGQFVGGDPKTKKTEVMQVGQWKIHVVDNNGTFADRMGGGPFGGGKIVKKEDWAMTGAILEHPEGRLYFVKMIGPGEVVEANRAAMIKMLKSVQ